MKLSIVIPVKNQSVKLLKHLKEELFPYFDKKDGGYEAIICSDASNDENQKILEDAMSSLPHNVRLLPYESTKGKGHAVGRAMKEAKGDYVLFLDADFATDLQAYDYIEQRLGEYDAFIGSRNVKGSKTPKKQGFLRRLLHFGSRTLIRMKFHLRVHDTQCGFKMFSRDVAVKLAERQIISGFAFDAEYCYMLRLNKVKTLEVPVTWTDDPDSSVNSPIKTSLSFYKDLRKIKKNKKNYLFDAKGKEKD